MFECVGGLLFRSVSCAAQSVCPQSSGAGGGPGARGPGCLSGAWFPSTGRWDGSECGEWFDPSEHQCCRHVPEPQNLLLHWIQQRKHLLLWDEQRDVQRQPRYESQSHDMVNADHMVYLTHLSFSVCVSDGFSFLETGDPHDNDLNPSESPNVVSNCSKPFYPVPNLSDVFSFLETGDPHDNDLNPGESPNMCFNLFSTFQCSERFHLVLCPVQNPSGSTRTCCCWTQLEWCSPRPWPSAASWPSERCWHDHSSQQHPITLTGWWSIASHLFNDFFVTWCK